MMYPLSRSNRIYSNVCIYFCQIQPTTGQNDFSPGGDREALVVYSLNSSSTRTSQFPELELVGAHPACQ
jgi:hypothetical protein